MISVVIRTKNEERWIAPCLRAVFGQTYGHIEVILVDNDSTDQTVKRANKITMIRDLPIGVTINIISAVFIQSHQLNSAHKY